MNLPGAGVLIIRETSVLLVRHGEKAQHVTGTYGIPAGRIDSGETEKQAAVRELLEESGLSVLEKDLIEYPHNLYTAVLQRKSGEMRTSSLRVFLAKKTRGKLQETEETKPEWILIKDLEKYNLLPNILQMVRDGKNYL